MEYQYRQQRQGDLAHPDGWIVTLDPEEDTGHVKENGMEQDDDDEGDAIAIEVLGLDPVVASWVEIANHGAYEGADKSE